MPKLSHPFNADKASGRFGDMLVFGSWKGISYVRMFCMPKVKSSARLRKVNELWSQQTRRWAQLPEKARLAWSAFTALLGVKGTPLSIFTKYSTLALDAGFPEPVFPPRLRKYDPPRLNLQYDKSLKALVVSWSFLLTPDASRLTSLADIYFCSSKPSHNPDAHRHHHLAFIPAKDKHFVLADPKPNFRYSFRVRLIFPDSNHTLFSSISFIYEP
jgi:hypothetical protein